jgi:hypothetical protein
MLGNKKLEHVGTIHEHCVITRQIDSYICLDVTIGDTSLPSPPLYWRVDEPKCNLVEIGIDRSSGRMVSFTVVLYNDVFFPTNTDQYLPSGNRQSGVPLFNLDPWHTTDSTSHPSLDYYDVRGKIRLELDESRLRINLFDDIIAYRIELSEDTACEFNHQQELCAFSVSGLSKSEVQTLKSLSSLTSDR